MAKLTLTDIANISGAEAAALATINANNDLIEAALENTLSRDGTTPNTMGADHDLNSNDIINVGDINTTRLYIGGQLVSIGDAIANPTASEIGVVDADSKITSTNVEDALGELAPFATVAAMVASTELSIGMRVGVLEYFDGDGSGGIGEVTNSGTADGGSVIALAGGLYWHRIFNEVNINDYGVVGDGVADDTSALQAALDVGAASKMRVVGGTTDNIYLATSTLRVKAGTRAFDILGTIIGDGSSINGLVHLDGPSIYVATTLTDCRISVNIDLSGGDLTAIKGDGTRSCEIDDCLIDGFIEGSKYGIHLVNSPKGNRITRCKIDALDDPTITQNLISIQGNHGAYGGYLPSGVIVRATDPARHHVVMGNELLNGSYAMIFGGAEKNVFSNNTCFNQNHRGVYMGPVAWFNNIADNNIRSFVSTAILAGYGSSHNVISNNECYTDSSMTAGGESCLKATTGGNYNLFTGNKVNSFTNYGVYIGAGAIGNIVQDNIIRGYARSGIHIDSDWTESARFPANADYARPNFAPAISIFVDTTTGADGAITASDKTFTSAANPFVVGDVGKYITIDDADGSGKYLRTTIASYTSAGEVELTDAATATVSSKSFWFSTYADQWVFTHTTQNVIKNNVIGAPESSGVYSTRAAISMSQIATSIYTLGYNIIKDNTVTQDADADLDDYLHIYAETATTGIHNTKLVENLFAGKVAGKIFLSDGRGHFSRMDGNDILDDYGAEVVFTAADTTPSVALGRSMKTAGTGTAITNFDDGITGQEIAVRGANTDTILYGSSTIRTKGAATVTFTSSVQVVGFIKLGTIWYETFRNF